MRANSRRMKVVKIAAIGLALLIAGGEVLAGDTTTATVGRSARFRAGETVTVRWSGEAGGKATARTSSQLKAKLEASMETRADLVARLGAKKEAKAEAKKNLKIRAKAHADARVKLEAKSRARAKAEAQLELKLKAAARAKIDLKKKKDALAKLEASGSVGFSLSFGKKKDKAAADVKKSGKKLDQAQEEAEEAQKKLDKAKAKEAAAKEEAAQKEAEEQAAGEELETVKGEIKEIKKEIEDLDEEIGETEELLGEVEEEEEAGQEQEVVVEDPPDTPPENDFGYEDPVWGCFEGEVMFIEPNTPKLPVDYSAYEIASRLYACEWDIPTRSFSSGFPGVEDKFEWFAIRYTGPFRVSDGGTYKFRINSDDGTKLYIDGVLVVDNDGTHPPQSREGVVELVAGDHDLVLEYFQGPRYHIALQVWVTAPGEQEIIFSVRE